MQQLNLLKVSLKAEGGGKRKGSNAFEAKFRVCFVFYLFYHL